MGRRLSFWLSEEEEEQIKKLKRKAKEKRRSLSSEVKFILFNSNGK